MGLRQGSPEGALLALLPVNARILLRNQQKKTGNGMADKTRMKNDMSPSPSPHHSVAGPRAKSIPLRTALRIARERQRSRSSLRKIFREDPDRYLDIVRLMKESGGI